MRTSSTLLQLLSLWGIALLPFISHVQGQQDANIDEPVSPLVLPEVKALPGYSFRGPLSEGKIPGFEVTGQA
jgi:hypothetical protein